MTTILPAPPQPVPAGIFNGRLRGLTIGAVALVSLLAFEALAVATAMPSVARALDGLPLYALAFGGPFASGVVGMVASGVWSDRRGPARPTWHGLFWFVVGLLVAGTAPTMGLVAAGRIVQGFGSGLLSVALYVVVGRAYPEQLHRRIFAAFAGAWVVPSLIGPAIAGLVVQYAGWRWIFLAVPALAVPAALLIRPAMRAMAVGDGTTRGALGRIGWAFGAALGAALLHYGGQQRGPFAVVLLVVAVVGLCVCAPRLLPAGFVRARRGLPTVVLLRGMAAAAFAGAEVFLPLLLSRERGLSPTLAGLVLAVGALSWSAGSWLQGRMTPPASRATLPRAGMLLIAVGIAVTALFVPRSVPVAVGFLGWAVTGFGMGLVYPTLSTITLELSAPNEQGRNSSALQLADSLFAAAVLAVGGALLAAAVTPRPSTYLAGLGVAAALAALGVLLAGRVTGHVTEPAGRGGASGLG